MGIFLLICFIVLEMALMISSFSNFQRRSIGWWHDVFSGQENWQFFFL